MDTFKQAHPVVIFSYFLSVLLLTMFQRHWVFVFLSFLCGLSTWILLDRRAIKKEWKFLFILLFMITFTNPLFVQEGVDIWFQNDYLTVTKQSLIYGFVFGGLIITMVIWFKILRYYLTDDHIVYIFGSMAPTLGVVISMSLRLTNKFTLQYHKIKEVNHCIYQQQSITNKLRQQLDILIILITWAFESSIDMMDSMNARGYGSRHRSHFHLFTFTLKDIGILVLIISISIFSFYGYVQYYQGFYYYPIIKETIFTMKDIFYYSIYVMLLVLPMLYHVGGYHHVSNR